MNTAAITLAKRIPGAWRVSTIRAGAARKVTRHWITNGPERSGWYPSEAAAQTECDRRNGTAGGAS